MIPFDFEYYRPDTLEELTNLYQHLILSHKSPVYYGGGTELISMARAGSIKFDSVIDIKNIAECRELKMEKDHLVIGSAVTLTRIAESGYFPLLGKTVARIADHTIQCKITLGGNIAGTIIYREAALPLMITNSQVKIINKNGELSVVPFSSVFNGRLHLKKGEWIVQILIDQNYLPLPYNHVKKTKIDKIDYPLVTLAAIKKDQTISAAVSGLTGIPFQLPGNHINNPELPVPNRVENTIKAIKSNISSDLSGSKEYKIFVLSNILRQMIENFEEVS